MGAWIELRLPKFYEAEENNAQSDVYIAPNPMSLTGGEEYHNPPAK